MTTTPWVTTVTPDAIQHFVWGIGDNNPRWLGPSHAAAPPCLLYAVHETTVAPGFDDRRRVYQSADWTWFDHAPIGTSITASAALVDESVTGAGVLEQVGAVEFSTGSGDVIASVRTCTSRQTTAPTASQDRAEVRYSGAQLDEIETAILAESRPGASPRYWEDTQLGASIGRLHKGPLSIMDVVAWCAGTQGVATEADCYSEGGLHHETATGPQQVSWLAQLVTDWMSDTGFLHRLDVQLLANAPLGSTTTLAGALTHRAQHESYGTVTLSLTATDQNDQQTATGTALVLLPTRTGDVVLPQATQVPWPS